VNPAQIFGVENSVALLTAIVTDNIDVARDITTDAVNQHNREELAWLVLTLAAMGSRLLEDLAEANEHDPLVMLQGVALELVAEEK
jgi:hypothetical protein